MILCDKEAKGGGGEVGSDGEKTQEALPHLQLSLQQTVLFLPFKTFLGNGLTSSVYHRLPGDAQEQNPHRRV